MQNTYYASAGVLAISDFLIEKYLNILLYNSIGDKMTVEEELKSFENGNISHFKEWLRKSTKKEFLELIELWIESGGKVKELKRYLEVEE